MVDCRYTSTYNHIKLICFQVSIMSYHVLTWNVTNYLQIIICNQNLLLSIYIVLTPQMYLVIYRYVFNIIDNITM